VDRDGRQLEADFVSFDNETVTVKRATDGRLFLLPVKQLSDKDQAFVESHARITAASSELRPASTPALDTPAGFYAGFMPLKDRSVDLLQATGATIVDGKVRVIVARAKKQAGEKEFFLYVLLYSAKHTGTAFHFEKCRVMADSRAIKPIAYKETLDDNPARPVCDGGPEVTLFKRFTSDESRHTYVLFLLPRGAKRYQFFYDQKGVTINLSTAE
jgi:hypothetical protein